MNNPQSATNNQQSNEGWYFADTASLPWAESKSDLFSLPIAFKIVGKADDYVMLLVDLPAGVTSPVHTHPTMEFLYVLEGSVSSNGIEMLEGHGFGSVAGCVHSEFSSESGAKVLVFMRAPDREAAE